MTTSTWTLYWDAIPGKEGFSDYELTTASADRFQGREKTGSKKGTTNTSIKEERGACRVKVISGEILTPEKTNCTVYLTSLLVYLLT